MEIKFEEFLFQKPVGGQVPKEKFWRRCDICYRRFWQYIEVGKKPKPGIRLCRLCNKRTGEIDKSCIICGFSLVVDVHHDRFSQTEYILCPNHHAMVTRKTCTLQDLLEKK